MAKIRSKLTGSEQVEMFLDDLDHPLKPAMEILREVILSVDAAITEHIKWNAPSFCHGGDDRVTLNLNKSGDVLLIFHRGAKPKPAKVSGRLIEDNGGSLEWPSDDRAILRFSNIEEVLTKREYLQNTVAKWIAAADE